MTLKRRLLDIALRCIGIKIIYCCENCRHLYPTIKSCRNPKCWLINQIIPDEARKDWRCNLWE